jgi:HAD superfamily hydrolase (TIGR01509 family)
MYKNQIEKYLKEHGFGVFHPKAVLFDMDGVLFNSMPNHAKSWNLSMATYGLNMLPEEAYTFEGMRGVDTIKLLAKRQWNKELSDEEAREMYKLKTKYFSACPKADKMPGAEELMKKVKQAGLNIVVVTGSGQKTLLGNLEKMYPGLISGELLVTSFDVTKGKPNPEPYLKGLKKANVKPWEAIVVENAPLGVKAGVAANIFTVAVNTGPLPDKELMEQGADILFHSMQDFCDNWDEFYSSSSLFPEVSI